MPEFKDNHSDNGDLSSDAMQVLLDSQSLFKHRQYDKAFEMLNEALSKMPDAAKLRRQAALALGAKVEYAMELADRLGIIADIDALTGYLKRAIEVDPDVPDLYWNIAVIKARFEHKFADSREFLMKAQAMGYQHPMMPRLTELIEAGLAGHQLPPEGIPGLTEGEKTLRQLLWRLVLWPDSPCPGVDPFIPEREFAPDEPMFNTFCVGAVNLVRNGLLDLEGYLRTKTIFSHFESDALEYVCDLMRILSLELGDEKEIIAATESHLSIIVKMANHCRSRVNQGMVWMRRAKRAARRGLKIIENLTVDIDPDLHAEVLLAYGQTFTHPSAYHLKTGLQYFLQGLDYKEKAKKEEDVRRLKDLMRQMIDWEIGQTIMAAVSGIGKLGQSLEDLEAGYEAAERIGEKDLIFRTALALASAYSSAQQPAMGEKLLKEMRKEDWLSEHQKDEVHFELASCLSESKRPAEALKIQQQLIAKGEDLAPAISKPILYMNTGNSLREIDDIEAAYEHMRTGLSLTKPVKDNEIAFTEGQLNTLIGQLEFMQGRPEEGQAYFEKAGSLLENAPPGVPKLHFHATCAATYFKAEQYALSSPHIEKVHQILGWLLSQGPSLPVWESMLQQWSYVDDYDVELKLVKNKSPHIRDAITAAERPKGRLMAWLRNIYDEAGAKQAFETKRIAEAVEKTAAWVNQASGRAVVSLYAAKDGLAVMAMLSGGVYRGDWLDDFNFDDFRENYFLPWEDIVDTNLGGDTQTWKLASTFTEYLLFRLGEWFWRAVPELAQGGESLIIVPHRFFRCLPVANAMLPGGRMLSELFGQVTLMPTIFDTARLIEKNPKVDRAPRIFALADPDGTLPMARLEAVCAVGTDHLKMGRDATAEALTDAVQSADLVLVSVHSDFDESNPWRSKIFMADGDFEIADAFESRGRINSNVLVLSSCEAGKSRRSWSDEPLAFPTLFQQAGIPSVMAPLWKVDDLSSMLFITRLFQQMGSNLPIAAAVGRAADWLRSLTNEEIITYTDEVIAPLLSSESALAEDIRNQLSEELGLMKTVLSRQPKQERYFRSPLYWAVYTTTGVPLSDD